MTMAADVLDIIETALANIQRSDAPAAVAALWGRQYALAADAWREWPAWEALIADTLPLALSRLVGRADPGRVQAARERFAREAEELVILPSDDGSDRWQHALDINSMVQAGLAQDDVIGLLRQTMTWYLEGVFNVLANGLADQEETGVISDADAWLAVSELPAWQAAVKHVQAG